MYWQFSCWNWTSRKTIKKACFIRKAYYSVMMIMEIMIDADRLMRIVMKMMVMHLKRRMMMLMRMHASAHKCCSVHFDGSARALCCAVWRWSWLLPCCRPDPSTSPALPAVWQRIVFLSFPFTSFLSALSHWSEISATSLSPSSGRT